MTPLKHATIWVSLLYCLILLCIALWVRDIPDQPDALNTTLQQIAAGITRMGDPASFAIAAIDFAETGRISGANEWIFNLWPPGFIMMQAFIIRVLGSEVPVILVLQLMAVLLFSTLLTLLYEYLNRYVKHKLVAMALPLLIFAVPVSRVVLLQPKGIVLGESFAIGFFLLGVLLTIRAVERHSLRYAICAGLCLAMSAYFRSQFEFILLVLTGWGILLLIVTYIKRRQNTFDLAYLNSLKTILIMLLVAHAATVPWRAYRWTYFYAGTPSWVTSSELLYRNSVMASEHLESLGGHFIVAGTGNVVCRIDPSTCGDTENAKELFFRTFVRHSVEWYSLKFDAIGEYWYSSLRNFGNVAIKSTSMDIITNALLLVALTALVCLSLTRKVRSHTSSIVLAWFNIALFSAYAIIFSLSHYEVRYFHFPKIGGIMMLLIVATLYTRPPIKKSDEPI